MMAGSTRKAEALGPLGHLILAVWVVAVILLVPESLFFPLAALIFALLAVLYPASFRRITRPRMLILILFFALPAVILGEADAMLFERIPFSLDGLILGLRMSVRALIILFAINGFTSAVSISSVAGVFERAGLQGLGFTLGVALNLLPSLRASAVNAWNSMRMRGGLKRNRLRSLQMLFITIITNALRRSEEIALAAEARAFSPEKSRPMPVPRGRYDLLLLIPALGTIIILLVV